MIIYTHEMCVWNGLENNEPMQDLFAPFLHANKIALKFNLKSEDPDVSESLKTREYYHISTCWALLIIDRLESATWLLDNHAL